MHNTDVAIIGGGLAGSLTAAMLGRAGIDAILVEPHPVYPPDFRCEKLDGDQVNVLRKTGLAEEILRETTHDRESWVARFGRIVDKRPGDQQGIMYAPLVNCVRGLIPDKVTTIHTKARTIITSDARQHIALSNGDEISARLVVLANGLSVALRDNLGIKRDVLSECHSISIGFNAQPIGRQSFSFPALTYYAEKTQDRAAYITLFPIGNTMRANFFVYRTLDDPWLREFRKSPQETLYAMMPRLRQLMGEFQVDGQIQIRPIDVYVTSGYRQPGIVLVGDAFATSCPAAGNGARKVLNDVERLCNAHVAGWLATPGMGVDKISQFYDDPVKRASDDYSLAKAFSLRSFSINPGLPWRARRWAKFMLQIGKWTFRRMFGQRPMRTTAPAGMPAATKAGSL
jgi:2-polyprenyl-6-methoxyphenol hydroxylase-like FAD-dependent oxidoreductase